MTREPPDQKRLKAQRRGALAEYRAAAALLLKGYRIVAFRYRTKLGEIDIIARKGDLVACVEVKARHSLDQSVFAVSNSAQQRIRAASDLWLSKQRDSAKLSIRYDIVSVTPWRWPVHLPDAF
ncbi:YraN family protein [Rhizobium sp. 32-5/1]|uniref:YraN family protein n=1 Tax=Rhizobium sp. 32-5/1 TaxID=3019602 RepID=UPI00240CFF66|nr:YraN family protein [Rhizobium sp. 32-5/1]WEZ84807.1 YraN family protein [Rhizobium sp. 32-5/1]